MSDDASADEIRTLLKLEPNQTCGFVRVTYVSDQLYHYYRGDPLELLLLKTDGTSEKVVIGPDLAASQHVQFFIPGNTFHTARVIGRRQWFLGGSTEWPGVIPADVELGDAEVLAKKYPAVATEIRDFPQPRAG